MTVMWYQLASVGCAVQLLLPLAYAELVYTVTENATRIRWWDGGHGGPSARPDVHYHQVGGLDVQTFQGRNTGPESSDFGHTSRPDHRICGMHG